MGGKKMSDTDFEFNMDFALMDQQIEKFKTENARILNEWYKDCELLHAQLADLHNINKELEQDLANAKEVLKHIEEQSRQSLTVVVGAPLREAVCSCLDSICGKIDK
jgi:DNA anti-recombination protein RmuC